MRIVRVLVVALAFLSSVYTASRAADTKPLTNDEAQMVLNGLLQLDGYDEIITDGQQKKAVRKFFNLGGGLRLQIAMSISALRRVSDIYRETTNTLIGQMSNGGSQVPPEKMREFTEQQDKLRKESSGAEISHIKVSELKLSENPIPSSTLSLIAPILDDDK